MQQPVPVAEVAVEAESVIVPVATELAAASVSIYACPSGGHLESVPTAASHLFFWPHITSSFASPGC